MAEKNTKPVQGPGGRGPKGPRPKVENPGKLFMRLLAYIMKNYAVHCILVVICIFITVLASVQGTWFMQTLIDGYMSMNELACRSSVRQILTFPVCCTLSCALPFST